MKNSKYIYTSFALLFFSVLLFFIASITSYCDWVESFKIVTKAVSIVGVILLIIRLLMLTFALINIQIKNKWLWISLILFVPFYSDYHFLLLAQKDSDNYPKKLLNNQYALIFTFFIMIGISLMLTGFGIAMVRQLPNVNYYKYKPQLITIGVIQPLLIILFYSEMLAQNTQELEDVFYEKWSYFLWVGNLDKLNKKAQ
ncbi:hypothetical protein [Mycoplasma hafezii]|uniref:hypothetical protein n=1 Tax=Mycoplasma hafezii TaxID=525886 RepID=UPI003CF4C3D1